MQDGCYDPDTISFNNKYPNTSFNSTTTPPTVQPTEQNQATQTQAAGMGNGSSCHAAGSCTVISTALSSALYSSTHRCASHRSPSDDDEVINTSSLHYDTSPTRSSSVSRTSTASAPAATGPENNHRSTRRRRRHRHKSSSSSSSQPVTVLLLDGRMIQFRHKVTAMQVLVNHQNHCLCPAQSLDEAGAGGNGGSGGDADAAPRTPPQIQRPNSNSVSALFKPVSLLPSDQLHPGRVYILIPLPTFELFAAAAHAAKKGTISPNYCKKLPLEVPSANGSSKRRHLTITKSSSAAVSGNGKKPAKCLTRTRSFDIPSPTSAARSAAAAIFHHNNRSSAGGSGSMRRCRSWTPRLQAIHEV